MLHHSDYYCHGIIIIFIILGDWPWQILGAIRAVARAGEPGDFFSFCQISNTRFYRFSVGQISQHLNTTRRPISQWILLEIFFWKFPRKGSFFDKTSKKIFFQPLIATSGRHNSAMIIDRHITKWSLYGKSVSIFTARRIYACAVLGVVILSVCPSAYPSVTRVLCD